jgi:hypothetical protein
MHTLGDFAIPADPEEQPEVWAPGLPPRFSIVKRHAGSPRFVLLYGEGTMMRTQNLHDVLAHLIWAVNNQTLRTTGDLLLIHAGSVSTPSGEGIVLPAPSGNGKTTLVTGLVRAGFKYLSDEAGAIDPVSRRLYPYSRLLTLKSGHAEVFPDLYRPNGSSFGGSGMCFVRPEEIREDARGGPCEIRFVIAHQFRMGATTELVPITQAQGAMELLTNAINLPRYRARALPLVADVARKARSYRLVSGNLDEAVDAISQVTNRGGRRRSSQPNRGGVTRQPVLNGR